MGFLNSIDISNRALQHVGATRIDPTLGFTEQSTNAAECAFIYDKVRQAELQRNTWAFATRKAILRPIDQNTMLLVPTLWTVSSVYFVGSIVADQLGQLWESTVANNVGNDPNNSVGSWDEYFGPMSVMLYDPSHGWNAGELVYTIGTGDQNYNVYRALVSNNNVDPSLPNQWSPTTTYFQNNVVQAFPAWASGTTYTQGQTITYADGNTYTSLTNGNVGNIPFSGSTLWALMPTLILGTQQVPSTTVLQPPLSSPVTEWNIGTSYPLGGFVMFNGTEYVSLINNNTGNYPITTGWAAVTNGKLYMSLLNLSVNNNPASAPLLWSATTTYTSGQTVGGSDGIIYSSLTNFNMGNNPVTDAGAHWTNTGTPNPWTTVFTQGGGNSMWLQVGGSSFPSGVALTTLNITYPLGSGPSTQTATRNAFRLPAGYLSTAPQDPKAGSVSYLGAPTGLQYEDWNYDGDYITSWQTDPIMLRFICDTVNVADWGKRAPMFCEGLAARIAFEICPRLTQSETKQKQIIGIYEEHMSTARLRNAIETGATEPPEDDYIATRI